ncbi:MAG: hypothetical protein WD942_08365 [Dehalococcoidia bacterium]
MAIRYRYALSAAGALVDVQAMHRSQRDEGAPFSCLSCARELIPALGEIQAHHFRHKQEQDCSSETYRHQLAKRVFVAEYERCLREGRPFHLIRQANGTCSFYKEQFEFTCRRTESRRHDLTRWFDRVDVEVVRNGLRADVLLWSERHGEFVFVEMAVTHACEPEKQQSGVRIIEIAIGTEDDAVALRQPQIDAHAHGVRLYNFQDSRVSVSCGGDCEHPISTFVVYPNGSAAIQAFPVKEAAAPRFLSNVPHKETLDEGPGEGGWKLFRRKLREAHFGGTPVRHCFMCRYHGVERQGAGIWCKVKKHVCESNEGAACEIFKALPSPDACDRTDKANDQFLQKQAPQRQERREARGSRQRAQPNHGAVLSARADMPRRTPGGRARLHWAGSVLLDSLRQAGLVLPPLGTPRLGRVVDWYLPNQVWRRQIVWLSCWMTDSGAFATIRGGDDPSPLPIVFIEADDGESMEQAVHLAFDAWSKRGGADAVVDSAKNWEPLPDGDPPYHLYPPRYRWSMTFRKWIPDDPAETWGE